ncbi:iron-sulfur cluster assembly accessory protein [Salaquimonas pukyongi]|uniref:iron-sulfur cluster assembly accessory protein n=1 Tax=Salaquimonas pukyongi TaxID=2712698 RepID=UPI00096B988F|nr:iron-sulfur cluster assembly accessory protein [Salaquimonas pukyongi]
MAFEVITVNEAAQNRLGEILAKHPDAEGIRIGVKNAGCAGMEYTVDLVNEPDPADDKVATPAGNVYVDPKATLFLLGTELGYEVTKLKTGFTFNNPNQTSACGCGESVELKPAEMTPEMLREREMQAGG